MRINHIEAISTYWNSEAENYKNDHPEHLNENMHPSWGLWHIPEKTLNMFDGMSLQGKFVLDLGCGRGHDAVAYAKLGAKVMAVDISKKQIENALPHENVNYIVSPAEKLPINDATIDIAVSDHGAFDHSPAPLLLKEMKRILQSNGQLIICTYSPLSYACYDSKTGKLGTSLINKYPSSEIKYDGKIINTEYSYAEWIKMFTHHGFLVERLEELIIPQTMKDYFGDLVDISWSSSWPCDIIWSLRKKG